MLIEKILAELKNLNHEELLNQFQNNPDVVVIGSSRTLIISDSFLNNVGKSYEAMLVDASNINNSMRSHQPSLILLLSPGSP